MQFTRPFLTKIRSLNGRGIATALKIQIHRGIHVIRNFLFGATKASAEAMLFKADVIETCPREDNNRLRNRKGTQALGSKFQKPKRFKNGFSEIRAKEDTLLGAAFEHRKNKSQSGLVRANSFVR